MVRVRITLISIFLIVPFLFLTSKLNSQEPEKTNSGNLICGNLINKSISSEKLKEFKLITQLISKNGLELGNVYVKTVNDSLFNSLIIEKDSKVLYEINQLNFWNTKGVDFDISKRRENFFGYKIKMKKKDYLIVGAFYDNGKSVSDDFLLKWNYQHKIFIIPMAP